MHYWTKKNIVTGVITGRNEDEVVDGVSDWEKHYGELHSCLCLRTSYNTQENKHLLGGIPFRGNYAGIGYEYLEYLDIFISPKPYDSWIVDEENAKWISPMVYPEDENKYYWNENDQSWDIYIPEEES